LISFYHQLSVSVQTYRLRLESSDSAHPNDIVSFLLPSALVNLDSLSLRYKVTTKQLTANQGTMCILNKGSYSPFTAITCESSSTVLDSLQSGWNRWVDIMEANTKKEEPYKKITENQYSWEDYKKNVHGVSQTFAAPVAGVAAAITATNVPAAPTSAAPWLNNGDEFILNNFNGTFIGTVAQRLFDCTVCPIRVFLRFDDMSRSFISDDITKFSAEYTGLYCIIQSLALNDGGVYQQKVRTQLESGGTIDFLYKRVRSFSSGKGDITNTLTAGIATSSLDALTTVFYGPESIDSTKSFKCSSSDNMQLAKNNYFRPTIGIYKEGVTGEDGEVKNTLISSQYGIQNILYPVWPASPVDQWEITNNSLKDIDGRNGCAPWINSMDQHLYANGAFWRMSFNFPGAEKVIRLRSGLNLLGTTAIFYHSSTGINKPDSQPVRVIYAEMSPVLKVMVGRQVEVIV
jgi:hypothetical protein